jgi:hypothetical protein
MVTLGSEHLAWVCDTLVRVRMLQPAWGLLKERVRGTWRESSGRSLSGRFRHAVVGTLARATGDSYSSGPLVQKSTEPMSSGHTESRGLGRGCGLEGYGEAQSRSQERGGGSQAGERS